ncbi:MAG: hypothetical protein MZV65_36055 [Chromatiales bacterium]|nr:hypothetical protein [Chromatiales bacterium]
MKTKLSLLFSLLLISAFVLAACGPAETPVVEEPAAEPDRGACGTHRRPGTDRRPGNPPAPCASGLTTPAPRSSRTWLTKCSPPTTSSSSLN